MFRVLLSSLEMLFFIGMGIYCIILSRRIRAGAVLAEQPPEVRTKRARLLTVCGYLMIAVFAARLVLNLVRGA